MNNKSIGIINCGVGNLKSLINALASLASCNLIISDDPQDLEVCDRLFFPGVGSFETASQSQNIKNLRILIDKFSNSGKPIMGICLGMQILFNSSSEGGNQAGLGLIDASIKHFNQHHNYSLHHKLLVPHVGFNTVIPKRKSKLFDGISLDERFYFTHSYFAPPALSDTLSETFYGDCGFTSAVQVDNIFAVQFHPELSGEVGLHLLENFLAL